MKRWHSFNILSRSPTLPLPVCERLRLLCLRIFNPVGVGDNLYSALKVAILGLDIERLSVLTAVNKISSGLSLWSFNPVAWAI